MVRLIFLRAWSAFLVLIQSVSSTPLASRGRYPHDRAQRNGTVWPIDVAGLAHDKTWPDFTEKTTRWSSYEAPTFNQVFLPETEEDLSIGVSKMSFASDSFRPWKRWGLNALGV